MSLEQIKSAIDKLPGDNIRFVKADYSMDIYSDGYQIDVHMDSKELFQFLGNLMETLGYQISVEVYPLREKELRVFISLR